MRLADQIEALFEEAVRECQRFERLELERVGLGISRWLAAFVLRVPCDDWLAEIESLFATLERDHVFVDEESRKAFIAWLKAVNAAAKQRADRIQRQADFGNSAYKPPALNPVAVNGGAGGGGQTNDDEDDEKGGYRGAISTSRGSRFPKPVETGRGTEQQYGSVAWFELLVRTREDWLRVAKGRQGVPHDKVVAEINRIARRSGAIMHKEAWGLAAQLLKYGTVQSKDAAIRRAARLIYNYHYHRPPGPEGELNAPPDDPVSKAIATCERKALQILAGEVAIVRFLDDVLTPSGVNDDPKSLDTWAEMAGGFAGPAGIPAGRGPSGPSPSIRPGPKRGGKGPGTKKPKRGSAKRSAPPAKPIEPSRARHHAIDHDATAYNLAIAWERDPATVRGSVRFNQNLVDAAGRVHPELRPDDQRIRRESDGRLVVDVYEVRSQGQTVAEMKAKMQRYKDILKDSAGVIDWGERTEGATRQ